MSKVEVTKSNLSKIVHAKLGVKVSEADLIVDTMIDGVVSLIQNNNSLYLHNLGTFKVTERAARKGRNPRTNQEIQIGATRSVSFTPAKFLKETVKGVAKK